MTVIRAPRRMAVVARRLERRGLRIGVVPTMGDLHAGHLSLIRAAAARNDAVIVTVFVNPIQFEDAADYRRYPRSLTRDVRLARQAGATIVFAPTVRAMYPRGFDTTVNVGRLGACWEGRVRPGHFRGVATVVALLFQLTRPTHAYFGQKDYQQTLVIKRLVHDLRWSVRLHVLPTVRDVDGLALSSRTKSLRSAQRRRATVLPRALQAVAARVRAGERRGARLVGLMRRMIRAEPGVRLEYAAVVDADSLVSVTRLRRRVAVLVAARVGPAHLIDNLLVDVP